MLRFYTDLLVVGLQAITAGYFYHTARLGRSGQYRTVKHQQVGGWGDVYRIKIFMTSVLRTMYTIP